MKKMSGGPNSVNIKIMLFAIALAIGFSTLWYTNILVENLQTSERNMVQLFAKSIEHISDPKNDNPDFTFLMDNIVKPITYPIIITDKNDSVNLKSLADIKNIVIDTTLSEVAQRVFLDSKVKEFDKDNHPVLVKYIDGKDTTILQKVHFGHSKFIKQLKFYPYFQMGIVAIFIVIGYIGFSQIKKSEQSNIWVGMAKETAHQFGTPISSLMGWVELLKMNYTDPDKVMDAAEEIENDVEKLSKITTRFSKIGSKTELKELGVYNSLTKVVEYFQRRLPQSGKKVSLILEGDKEVKGMINIELFEWVIENLVKNALDAIEHENGVITIHIKDVKNKVEIEVADNGKGIEYKRRSDVFRPGYSTKRRGWGLGLSLSRRIINDYHKGKIFVKASAQGVGTTFKILLNKNNS